MEIAKGESRTPFQEMSPQFNPLNTSLLVLISHRSAPSRRARVATKSRKRRPSLFARVLQYFIATFRNIVLPMHRKATPTHNSNITIKKSFKFSIPPLFQKITEQVEEDYRRDSSFHSQRVVQGATLGLLVDEGMFKSANLMTTRVLLHGSGCGRSQLVQLVV